MTDQSSKPTTQKMVVANPDGPDLEFSGHLCYEGVHSELGSIKIYRTSGGRIVLRQLCYALRGRPYRNETQVFESLDDLCEHLGTSDGAKQIQEALGRPMRIVIE
ncbi:MAG: hypothetical protein KIT20_13100 [Alphaproteobacteria bacterium]|nr:hypothetical protein [Alphaproteobacteria bacterium]